MKDLVIGVDNMNLGGDKKIFEEEKTLRYSEEMLVVQVLAKGVIDNGVAGSLGSMGDKVDELVKSMNRLLGLAIKDPKAFGVAASSGHLFSKFHCLAVLILVVERMENALEGKAIREAVKSVIGEGNIEDDEDTRVFVNMEIIIVLKELLLLGDEKKKVCRSKVLFLL